jgi:hypothetical protein
MSPGHSSETGGSASFAPSSASGTRGSRGKPAVTAATATEAGNRKVAAEADLVELAVSQRIEEGLVARLEGLQRLYANDLHNAEYTLCRNTLTTRLMKVLKVDPSVAKKTVVELSSSDDDEGEDSAN